MPNLHHSAGPDASGRGTIVRPTRLSTSRSSTCTFKAKQSTRPPSAIASIRPASSPSSAASRACTAWSRRCPRPPTPCTTRRSCAARPSATAVSRPVPALCRPGRSRTSRMRTCARSWPWVSKRSVRGRISAPSATGPSSRASRPTSSRTGSHSTSQLPPRRRRPHPTWRDLGALGHRGGSWRALSRPGTGTLAHTTLTPRPASHEFRLLTLFP